MSDLAPAPPSGGSRPLGSQPLRFIAVGAWNTGLSYLIYVATYRLDLSLGLGEVTAYRIAFIVAYALTVPQAFLAYKWIVFRTRGNYRVEFGRFLLSNLLLPLINYLALDLTGHHPWLLAWLVPIAAAVARPFRVERLVDVPTVAGAFWAVILAILAYLLHRQFSFRPRPVDRPETV